MVAGKDPSLHAAVRRLASMDSATAATLISRATDRPWVRAACEAWLRGESWATMSLLGVYALPDAHGATVPGLLVDLTIAYRGKTMPARAAVVGLFDGRRGVAYWAREPDTSPQIHAARLA